MNISILIILSLSTICFIQAFYLLRMYIQHNNKRFLLLFDDSSEPKNYFFYDFKGKKSHFSDNLIKILGIQNNAALVDLKLFISQESYAKLEDVLFNSTSTIDVEFCLPNEEKIIFACSCKPVVSNFGTAVGMMLWFEDITGKIEAINKLNLHNKKLQLELENLHHILNKIPLPIWQRDELCNITYFNFAYSKIISQKEDAAFDFLALEISKKSRDLALLAHQEKSMKNEEIYIVTNGQRCLFNVFEIATYLGGTLGFAIDMSAKDKIKHELERYICAQSDLLESSASAMAIFTSDMRIQSYNQAFIKLWGLDESWLNSKPTYGQILEELRERRKLPEQVNFSEFKKNHLKFFTELLTPHNEFFYLPDGTALRVLVIAHALGGLLFAYEDMTDHLALERSYNILIAVQKATIDALQESIAVYGSDGKLKICNPGYIKVCGLEESFFAQQPHINEVVNFGKEFYLEDHWQQAKLDLVRTINERKSCETIMERKNGTILKRRSMPLPDGAFLVTYLDITDSVMLERSLLQHNQVLLDADTSKTEFLANISYELRSPLTSVLGFSELLMKECFGNLNEKQQEYVLAIYQSSQYVMTLVNDILDIASLEAGYNDLELLYFDVYQAILAVIATINERIKSEKLHFTLNCSPFFGKMLGDERRFKQVVLKLLSNAIKFNKPEGYINLTMSEGEDHKIILIVEDNGIGISYDEQKMVFDKFYRNELHKTGKSGVGLGLSIVKSFVELHNGSIVIDAERKIGTKISCIFDRINPLLLVKLNQNHPGELIA